MLIKCNLAALIALQIMLNAAQAAPVASIGERPAPINPTAATSVHSPLQYAATDVTKDQQENTDAAKLKEKITALRKALTENPRERDPLKWAEIQNNLGATLGQLGAREGDRALLHEAITAFREALKERTRERAPLDWAGTQSNLGNGLALLGMREGNRALLHEAITAFREALKEGTRERVPLDWAATQNNLGNTLGQLGKLEDDGAILKEAIAAYRAAIAMGNKLGATHYVEEWKENLARAESSLAKLRK